VAYRDRAPSNWGVLAAILLAVPAVCIWALVDLVGGALACEGVDGPCGGGGVEFLTGVVVIGLSASGIGWLINRLIACAGRLRRG
jgi:hypothetical protein